MSSSVHSRVNRLFIVLAIVGALAFSGWDSGHRALGRLGQVGDRGVDERPQLVRVHAGELLLPESARSSWNCRSRPIVGSEQAA